MDTAQPAIGICRPFPATSRLRVRGSPEDFDRRSRGTPAGLPLETLSAWDRMAMRVTVNGKAEDFNGEITVAELLAHLRLEPIRVAVEVNEDVIPRDDFAGCVIHDGDRIEIVTFVGGG